MKTTNIQKLLADSNKTVLTNSGSQEKVDNQSFESNWGGKIYMAENESVFVFTF